MSGPTGSNMKADAFQTVSRSITAPALPPKDSYRGSYWSPRDPDTHSSPPVSLKSPKLPVSSPESQSRSLHQSATLNSTSIGYGSMATEGSVCPPPLPPKLKKSVYMHPSSLNLSETSDGRQTLSAVSSPSTESELKPSFQTEARLPCSPSKASSSLGPLRTQAQESEGSAAVGRPLTSQSPQPPSPPAPKARRTYLTFEDITDGLGPDARPSPSPAPCSSPTEGPPFPSAQVPTTPGVTSQQRSSPRPSTLSRCPALGPDHYYQEPRGSLFNNSDNVKTTEDRDHSEAYQSPRPSTPSHPDNRDRAGIYLSPSSAVGKGYSYMSGQPSPAASPKQNPKRKSVPGLSPPSAIYETILEPQLSAAGGGDVSPWPVRPRPPSFSPPPPPSSPRASWLQPMVLNPEDSKTPVYLKVLPDHSGFQGITYGTLPRSQMPSRSLPRSQSEPLLDNDFILPRSQLKEEEEVCLLAKWWNTMKISDFATLLRYSMTVEEKTRNINQIAKQIHMVLNCYQSMLLKRAEGLRSHISELKIIVDNLEKLSQRHQVMGITGGTTSAVGGVAAVVGIALAPVTMGVSLVATAVGAGVAVAAGGMGAGSAMKKKKSKNIDRKRVKEILKEYRKHAVDLEECLAMVRTGMEELRRHDVASLTGASEEAVWMAHVAHVVYSYTEEGGAKPAVLSTDDILKRFEDVEAYDHNNASQKLKKGSEKKFAKKVCMLAQELQKGLDDMNQAWEIFSLATGRV